MKDYHDLEYEELKQLHTDIAQLLEDKKEEALEKIRSQLENLGLNMSDLAKKPKSELKIYGHPENEELRWEAKRGKRPKWLQELIDGGTDLEELRVA